MRTLLLPEPVAAALPVHRRAQAAEQLTARSGSLNGCGVKKPGLGHAAARSYSWIRPPRRSLRTIPPAGSGAGASPLGVRWPSPWCGRASW